MNIQKWISLRDIHNSDNLNFNIKKENTDWVSIESISDIKIRDIIILIINLKKIYKIIKILTKKRLILILK